jgi:hypothetical protein
MKIKKMDSHTKFYYDAYKKDKKAFSNWMANNIKNGIRIVDQNDCREAWNAAITAAIRMANRSNEFDLIDNLKKLKDIED